MKIRLTLSVDTQTWNEIKINSSLGKLRHGISSHSAVMFHNKLHVLFGGTYVLTGMLSTEELLLSCDFLARPKEDSLSTDWKRLFNNRNLSDIEFLSEDRSIYAHLLVLCARCPVLYEIARVSSGKKIEVSGIGYKRLWTLLFFIYTGQISPIESLEEALHLVIWCRRLKMSDLLHLLERMILPLVNAGNISSVLLMAEKHELSQLKVACIVSLEELCKNDPNNSISFQGFSSHLLQLIAERNLAHQK